MIRTALSAIMGLVLIFIQSMIVMKMNSYESIHFPNLMHVLIVWILNFFLVFSILSHMKPWFEKSAWIAKLIK